MSKIKPNLSLFSQGYYLGFILSEESRQRLIDIIGATNEIRVCHHITIQHTEVTDRQSFENLEEYMKENQQFRAEGVIIGKDQTVVMVKTLQGSHYKPFEKIQELLHITYERSRLAKDSDSKNITEGEFHEMDLLLEGKWWMMEKGGKTPTTVNEQWINTQIKKVSDSNLFSVNDDWVPCGYTAHGQPMAFVLRNKNGPSRTVNMDLNGNTEYRVLLDDWKRRQDLINRTINTHFIMSGIFECGWIGYGLPVDEEPTSFAFSTHGRLSDLIHFDTDPHSRFQMLLSTWRLQVEHLSRLSNSSVCFRGEHYEGCNFNREGLPRLFRNVKNMFLNYSATHGAEGFNKLLELWKARNSYKPTDYIVNVTNAQKEEETTMTEEVKEQYSFNASIIAAKNEWVAMDVDSGGVPAYFMYRAEGKPSKVIPREMRVGSKYMALFEAWLPWIRERMEKIYQRHIRQIADMNRSAKFERSPVKDVPLGSDEKDMVVADTNSGYTGYNHNKEGYPTTFFAGAVGKPAGRPINNRLDFQQFHRLLTLWCVNNNREMPKNIRWDEFNVLAEPKAEVTQSVDTDGTVLINGTPKCALDGL